MKLMGLPGRVLCAVLLISSAACTTVTITPDSAAPPPTVAQSYHAVALEAVDAKQPEFAYLAPFFREGFVRRLKELKAFDSVVDNPATPPAQGRSL